MLVLTRQQNQRIIIGDDIVITLVQIQGSKVRIGIEAPQEVDIRREELPPRIKPAVPLLAKAS
jgi:carbon storage regulator